MKEKKKRLYLYGIQETADLFGVSYPTAYYLLKKFKYILKEGSTKRLYNINKIFNIPKKRKIYRSFNYLDHNTVNNLEEKYNLQRISLSSHTWSYAYWCKGNQDKFDKALNKAEKEYITKKLIKLKEID